MSQKAFPLHYNNHNYLYQMVKNATKITNTTKEITHSQTSNFNQSTNYMKPNGPDMLFVALWFLVAILLGLVYLYFREKRAPTTRSERTLLLINHQNKCCRQILP